jgi:hypothetical protein
MYGGRLYGGVTQNVPYYQEIFFTVVLDEVIPTPRVLVPTRYAVRPASELPPTRLSISIETPDGYETRWSSSEISSFKSFQGLTFTTTMPGGFEHLDVTVIRDPRRAYPDLRELERLTVRSVGGDVIWQGRLETIPSASGSQVAFTPSASGYQAALMDDNSARELYVETNLSTWEGPTLNRQIYAISGASGQVFDLEGGTVAGNPDDPSNHGVPAMVVQFQGPWSREHSSEQWYDAQGLPIGYILYSAQVGAASEQGPTGSVANQIGNMAIVGQNWIFGIGLCVDDAAAIPNGLGGWTPDGSAGGNPAPISTNFAAAGPYFTGRIPSSGLASGYDYAFVQLINTASGGTTSFNYALYFRQLVLYGTQGLPIYPADTGTMGVFGSDVVKHAVPKYTPEIAITYRGQSTIVPSTYVIPELVFLTSGTVSDIIKGVSAFELQDWAVWEGDTGPCFYWYPRTNPGTVSIRGRLWRTRIGPAQFQATGPQIDRLYNGVVVNFTDFTGLSRTVGPPGSSCWQTDPALVDSDPQNPINEWGQGIRKWAPITMSAQSTLDQAVAAGAVFLQEQKVRNQSGSAEINGYIEDATGVVWPAYMVRAGDQIAFIDAEDPSYRRIVSTSYNDDTKTNSITLDTPPDTLQAILTRLQANDVPIVG